MTFQRHQRRIVGCAIATAIALAAPAYAKPEDKAKLVVQDASSYQQLLEAIDRLEAIEGIKRGLAEIKRHKGKPLAQADKEIRRKYRIPRDI